MRTDHVLALLRPRLLSGLDLTIGRWAIWLAAAICGGVCATLSYAAFKSAPATYPEFIVGAITFAGAGKAGDYAMLFGWIGGFTAAFLILALLFQSLAAITSSAVDEIHNRFIIAVLPAIAWLGTLLIPRNEYIGLFWVAAFLVIAMVTAAMLVTRRPHLWTNAPAIPAAIDGFVLLFAGIACAAFAVAMFGNRIAILFGPRWFSNFDGYLLTMRAIAVAGFGAAVLVMLRASTAAQTVTWQRRLVILVQALLPGLFLAMLPYPITTDDAQYLYAQPIRATVWMMLATLTLFTWADLWRLWRRGERENGSPADAVSAFALIAVLIYCRIPGLFPPNPFDDYHFGEDVIPWWAWVKHGLVPLWDFTPPRGLINYKWGLLASLFSDPSASGALAIVPYRFGLTMAIVFLPIALLVGKWRAFLILAFATVDERLGDIDMFMAAALCLLAYAWIKLSDIGWLVAWLVIGTAAVLLAPGQGGLLVLATAPGGLWKLVAAFRADRKRLIKVGAVVAVIALALAAATPLGLMVVGAVRYGAGQSAVNGIANGIPWATTFAASPDINRWLFEIWRFSWIAAGSVVVILTLRAGLRKHPSDASVIIFTGVAISILCLAFVIRSAVRLDAVHVGRPGWTSLWVMASLLPIFFSLLFRGREQLNALAMALPIAATLTGVFGVAGVDEALSRPFGMLRPNGLPAINGPSLGMPNLGHVTLKADHAAHLVSVKTALDELLDPNETFLDMTNRGAQYFYFDRVPPSDLSAFYNMITVDQQRRAVDGLIRRKVPVALINADNQVLDDIPASLRAPLVYRYLVLHFVPVAINDYGFMVRPDRLARAGTPDAPTAAALDQLDTAFLPRNLRAIPFAWGRSAESLGRRMREVVRIDSDQITPFTDMTRDEDGAFKIVGPKPAVAINIANTKVRGRDAGLLRFAFVCANKRPHATFVVRWSGDGEAPDPQASLTFSARQGMNIVPLDAAPRWLLAAKPVRLELEMTQVDGCRAFTLNNVALAQRVAIDEMEAALGKNSLGESALAPGN